MTTLIIGRSEKDIKWSFNGCYEKYRERNTHWLNTLANIREKAQNTKDKSKIKMYEKEFSTTMNNYIKWMKREGIQPNPSSIINSLMERNFQRSAPEIDRARGRATRAKEQLINKTFK